MKQITKSELLALLVAQEGRGTNFVGLDYTSPQSLKKTGNPYADALVTKSVSVSGMINADYEARQNRQLVSEGKTPDFVVGERKHGEHLTSALVVGDDGDTYKLQLQGVTENQNTTYRINGEYVEYELIAPYIKSKTDTRTVKEYRLDRINGIRIDGEEYIIL